MRRCLAAKIKEALDDARAAMASLTMSKDELAERAFALYERFRPAVAGGTRGWGAAGTLIRSMAKKAR